MKRIGLISPNMSEEVLTDVYRILPPDITVEGRGLRVREFTDQEFARAESEFFGLVRELTEFPLDFLMVTGELFLSYKGPGSDRQLLEAVAEVTPVPASTVLTSVVDACRNLGLKRVVMASPFPEDQDARLVRFLEHDEIHVTAYRGLAYENSRVIWTLPPESGLEVARPLLKDNPDVDGLYMPCNKWRITPVIDQLEQEFGKPVVTNTQAWIWTALKAMGLNQPVEGYGRLLARL
jgi:maleate cis-trans isomerase